MYEDVKATKEGLLEVLYSLEEALLTLETQEGDFPEKQILKSELKKAKRNEVRAFREPESLRRFDEIVKEIEEAVLKNASATPEMCRAAVEKNKNGDQKLKKHQGFCNSTRFGRRNL